MELIQIIGIGFFVAALVNSGPWLMLLDKLKLENYTALTCGLCLGAWFGAGYGLTVGINFISTAGLVSIVAELTDRILKSWRI